MYFPLADFHDMSTLSSNEWLLMIFLGLNTLIAYGSLSESFKYVEANKVSIIVTMNPIITFVVISILLEFNVTWVEAENISLYGFIGAILVLSGAILAIRQSKKNS